MKIKLTENDIKKVINETIKTYLNEIYGIHPTVFEDNPNLQAMEQLVYKFTLKSVEENDFNEFVNFFGKCNIIVIYCIQSEFCKF